MKFGKHYQEQLQTSGVPQEWIDKAVKYKELKKVIHKYMINLEKLGLDKDCLKILLSEGESQIIMNDTDFEYSQERKKQGRKLDDDELVRMTTNSSEFSIGKYLNRDRPWTFQKQKQHNVYASSSASIISSQEDFHYKRNPFDTNMSLPGSTASSIYSFDEFNNSREVNANDNAIPQNIINDEYVDKRRKIGQFSDEEFDVTIIALSENDIEYEKPFAKYRLNDSEQYSHPRLQLYLINPAYNNKCIQQSREGTNKDALSEGIISKVFRYFNEISKTEKLKVENIKFPYILINIIANNDDYFFRTIIDEIDGLNTLIEEQHKYLGAKIRNTKRMVESFSRPNKFRSDKSIWRQIFEIYTEYRIFFQTDDLHGERPFGEAEQRLISFQKEIIQSHLSSKFNHKQSRLALKEFIGLNAELLISLKYTSLNKIATQKILKKFDKQTSFGIKSKFPSIFLNNGNSFLKKSMVYDIYTSISSEVVSIVPMIENHYDCPVCFMLAYRPITLDCGHTFCLQCVLNMKNEILAKRKKKKHPSSNIEDGEFDEEDACPVCRAHTIELADITNINLEMMNFMELHFPKECQEKIKLRRKEIDEERQQKYYQLVNSREGADCVIC